MQPDNHLIIPTSREVLSQLANKPASRLGKIEKEALWQIFLDCLALKMKAE
jgi:hypothetical protein